MTSATHTATYTIVGMTCSHCVASVTEELTDVKGVADVDVDLATGRLTVTSDEPVDGASIRSAVSEASYHVAGNSQQ